MPESASIGRLVFVRLLRKWSAARTSGENPLPHMQALAAPFDPSPDLTVACASLFDLVEAHLGRLLVPECCCSHALSRDEDALLGLLRYAPDAGLPLSSAAIPHGLPGAIRWASFAVTRALDATFGEQGALGEVERGAAAGAVCPFGSAGKHALPVLTLGS